MSLLLKNDPDWPENFCSTDLCGGALSLLGRDGCQVLVPAELLLAVSPLVRTMMTDLLPPAFSPHVISIPGVTGAVLLMVAELLSKGTAVVHANKKEVQEVFKMMRIEACISCCVADMEVKDEDLTKGCSQSDIYIKIEKSDDNKESEYYEDFRNLAADKVENKNIESNLSEGNNSLEVLLRSNENKPEDEENRRDTEPDILRQHSSMKHFKCDQCEYKAARRDNLKQHMLIHTGEKPFACGQCSYRAVSRGKLKRHLLVHSTRVKPFACDQCSYRAGTSSCLKQHVLIHMGERSFACDQCAHRAISSARLKQHMLVHSRERLFDCDQCSYRAVSRGSLKRHLKVHLRKRAFNCDQCSYKAVSRELLNQHLRVHAKERFACGQCSYGAVSKRLLKQHMQIHSKEKPFA